MTTLALENGTEVFGRRLEDKKNLVEILSYECGEPIDFFSLQNAIDAQLSIVINSNHIENRDTDQRTIMTVKNARKFGILLEFEEE